MFMIGQDFEIQYGDKTGFDGLPELITETINQIEKMENGVTTKWATKCSSLFCNNVDIIMQVNFSFTFTVVLKNNLCENSQNKICYLASSTATTFQTLNV